MVFNDLFVADGKESRGVSGRRLSARMTQTPSARLIRLGGFTLDNPPDEPEDRLKLEDELREEGDLRPEQDEDGAAYVVLGASAEFSDLNGSETSIEADNIIELKDVTDEIEVRQC